MKPFSILFSIALFAACGVSPTASPTTYQDFAIAQNQASCEAQFRCCGTRCSTATDQTFNKGLLATQKLIDANKVTFDAPSGKTCIDSYRARYMDCELSTTNLPTLSPTCNQVVVGKLALGQSCDPAASFCIAGTYCDSSGGSSVCTGYLADGATCGMGRCGSTSYCDVTATQTCKPLPKNGQACTALSGCDTSTAKLVCLPSMVCGPPAADGAACTSGTQCLNGTCGVTAPRTCLPSTTLPTTVREALCK